ncbi:RDD family protein [Mucilaginibacter sp. HMF5004]|uniref:RDD family protein n=1 Tax=Mucilaginibacter rivuli TaxID=2857527 RepID=UPI001C5D2967|nr:RDD family protein [Mucilaginibacter rivuli]MBW4888560.1 RDD family protein [Mucilaginibacter rivuli]
MTEATDGKRFLNYIIDRIILWLFFTTGPINFKEYSFILPGKSFTVLLIYGIICFAYYFLTEYFLGKTPAKFLTKTLVVDVNGNMPSARVIATRTLCRLIPFDALSFIFATNGWHDSISDTRVVTVLEEVPFDETQSGQY